MLENLPSIEISFIYYMKARFVIFLSKKQFKISGINSYSIWWFSQVKVMNTSSRQGAWLRTGFDPGWRRSVSSNGKLNVTTKFTLFQFVTIIFSSPLEFSAREITVKIHFSLQLYIQLRYFKFEVNDMSAKT